MNLRERLTKVAETALKEGVESSKDIINKNVVSSFEDMGMANVEPGEFAQGEITDKQNLVNQGSMSNDTDFNKEGECPVEKALDTAKDMLDDLVDISEPDVDATLKIVKTSGEEHGPDCDCPECCHKHHCHPFGGSLMGKIIENALGGKDCEQYLKEAVVLKESDFAGPKDFTPDIRLNFAEVLNALKQEIGEGSEGIHVDVEIDDRKNNCYKVSQVDKEKLPKTLKVNTTELKLDGDTYHVVGATDEYPLNK